MEEPDGLAQVGAVLPPALGFLVALCGVVVATEHHLTASALTAAALAAAFATYLLHEALPAYPGCALSHLAPEQLVERRTAWICCQFPVAPPVHAHIHSHNISAVCPSR